MAAEPTCALSHDLLNQLTSVIAECELMMLEEPECPGLHRVLVIKELSVQMARHVSRHQCQVTEMLRDRSGGL